MHHLPRTTAVILAAAFALTFSPSAGAEPRAGLHLASPQSDESLALGDDPTYDRIWGDNAQETSVACARWCYSVIDPTQDACIARAGSPDAVLMGGECLYKLYVGANGEISDYVWQWFADFNDANSGRLVVFGGELSVTHEQAKSLLWAGNLGPGGGGPFRGDR